MAVLVQTRNECLSREIENATIVNLLRKGYTVSTRSDLPNLLEELKRQNSGDTEQPTVNIGEFLNVGAVLLTTPFVDRGGLSSRLLDLAGNEVLWVGSSFANNDWTTMAHSVSLAFPSLVEESVSDSNLHHSAKAVSYDAALSRMKKVIFLVNHTRAANISARKIQDVCYPTLLRKGFQVPSQSDVDKIVEEIAFQHSGLTFGDAAEIGKMMNAEGALVTYLLRSDRIAKRYTAPNGVQKTIYYELRGIGMRLLDIERAEILWVSSAFGSIPANTTKNAEEDLLADLAAAAIGNGF